MLSRRIKELRTSRNLTQVELAKALNVSKQSVSNWENDNIQPSIDMLIRIAEYFSVSTDFLLGLEHELRIQVTGLTSTQCAHIQSIVNDILRAT